MRFIARQIQKAAVSLRGGSANISAGLFLALPLLVTGCGYFLGSKSRPPQVEFKQSTEQCLSHLKENMSSWAKTGLPSMGLQIDCIVRGIDQFSKQTRGGSGEGWTKVELGRFFDTYFPARDGTRASLWIDEILKLKQSWFGGYGDQLTRHELDLMRSFLLDVKPDLDAISPYAPKLLFKSSAQLNDGSLEILSNSLFRLAEIIVHDTDTSDTVRPAYDVDSFLNLLFRLGVLKEKTDRLRQIGETLKGALAGGAARFIVTSEWPRAVRATAKTWALALRLKYGLHDLSDNFTILEPVVAQLLEILDDAVGAQDPRLGGLPVARIEDVFDAFADPESGVLEFQMGGRRVRLRSSTIRGVLPNLFGKVLYGNSKLDREEMSRVLRREHLVRLRAYANEYLEGQRALGRAFGEQEALSPSTLIEELRTERGAGQNLRELLSRGRPVVRGSDGRIVIGSKDRLPPMTRASAILYNATRVVVTALFDGYSHRGLTDKPTELNAKEVEEIYWDERELGIDFNVTDVRNLTAAGRTFLEASIFTSVSRGRLMLSIGEITEWFHLAVGASFLGDQIYSGLPEKCFIESIDVFGQRKMNTPCFRENFWPNLAQKLPNLPGLIRWYDAADPGTRSKFALALEDAGRMRGANENVPIDSSELRTMIPILHYLESLLTNHDTDGDGTLNNAEVSKAFPVFKNLLREKANLPDFEYVQKLIFSYMLYFGKPPEATFRDVLPLLVWPLAPIKDSADRLQILNVIASFNVLGRRAKAAKLAAYLETELPLLRENLEKNDPDFVYSLADAFGCRARSDRSLPGDFAYAVQALPPEAFASQERLVAAVRSEILSRSRFDLKCDQF